MDDINLHSRINSMRILDASRHVNKHEAGLLPNDKTQRLNDVVCEFVCDRIPASIPDWIWVEHQGIEDRFYCLINWHHLQLEGLLAQEFDPTDSLLALVQSLGFVNVERIEWNTRFEHES